MAHVDLIDWNAAALKVVELIRTPVYAEPRLTRGAGTRTAQGRKAPDADHRRRMETRQLNEELSRYYPLGENQSVWKCPELLLKGKHDVVTRHHDIQLTGVLS
jgi:hypothetical protein